MSKVATRSSGRKTFANSPNRVRGVRWIAAGIASVLLACLSPAVTATAADSECQQVGGAWQITASCIDPGYTSVVVTSESDETSPVPLHKVSGRIGTTDFNIYLPSASQWHGRFFQQTYPTQPAEAPADVIAFGAASGGYTVNAAGTGGYRQEAALAKYAKTVAARYYGFSGRIYGYLYGASGGSYPTIGAMENTIGVWDGAVPTVMATPTSIPTNFFSRAYARFVLGGVAQRIADAMSPGGSGNPYAGLTALQSSVLREVTRLGVPLSGWSDPAYVLGLNTSDGLLGFLSTLKALDPSYVTDFWSAPGYLGTEASALGDYFRRARVTADASIASIRSDSGGTETGFTIAGLPQNGNASQFEVSVANAQGTLLPVAGLLDGATSTFALGTVDASTRALLVAGARIHVDNSGPLAAYVYHRYQTPTAADFHAWDQYRDAHGAPIYPVRNLKLGEIIAGSVSGNTSYSGKVNGKVILVDDLLDVDAFPWDASWYSERAKNALGAAYNANFRIWYFQNADHVGVNTTRVVPYTGFVQQALRDLSAWVERGIVPASSTKYSVSQDTQIAVGDNAAIRGGIQPTVRLTVDGRNTVNVRVGDRVQFKGTAQVPPRLGAITKVEWDLIGSGSYTTQPGIHIRPVVELKNSYVFDKPGIYYVAVRVTAQRDGDANTPYALVQNLDRVRVVVSSSR